MPFFITTLMEGETIVLYQVGRYARIVLKEQVTVI